MVALIWGARVSDLTELWTRFQEGYQLGEARISPTDFLFFAVVFAIGLSATRLFQGALKNSILPRTSMDQGGQNAIVSGLGYVGVLLSALVAINSTGIDLSGLAIVAGALSVGIGFGSQNLVNNFISGLLVMMERPIRVHDYIEVDGISGRVQSIGIRSTMVRTLSNSLVVIPNTTFIEKNLTNWTMSGTFTAAVRFGVAYGTDANQLKYICISVIVGIEGIATSIPPGLTFVDFGDNALVFDLAFSLEAGSYPLRKGIESEIRYRLNEAFNTHGIEVPFPQREVRLNFAQAVPVRLQN